MGCIQKSCFDLSHLFGTAENILGFNLCCGVLMGNTAACNVDDSDFILLISTIILGLSKIGSGKADPPADIQLNGLM